MISAAHSRLQPLPPHITKRIFDLIRSLRRVTIEFPTLNQSDFMLADPNARNEVSYDRETERASRKGKKRQGVS